MSSPSDRLAQLEIELAEVKAQMKAPAQRPARRFSVARRFAILGLALALLIPAGIVMAGAQTFNDVPPSHKFFADVEAVAAAGITSGCPQGTNNYCPDGLVTRGQMAAFLNRLGALGPGKVPKANADRLDGASAEAFARPLFAVVNEDGSLARGNGAVSSSQTAPPGDYLVTFNRDITSCAYIATIGLTGSSGTATPGQIDVVRSSASAATVWVATSDGAGAESNRPFHLVVMCAGATGASVTAETSGLGNTVGGPAVSASGENE
jgi:hypothetical protein